MMADVTLARGTQSIGLSEDPPYVARCDTLARPQVSDPAWRRRPQSLWAREWRSQVMTGWVRGARNGAAFTVGVAADRRSSAPPPQPFLVVCVGLVGSVGCPRGSSNALTLRRCMTI
jgi:hypothetical protein